MTCRTCSTTSRRSASRATRSRRNPTPRTSGVIARAILTLFGKLDGQDRASVLANLQEMGESDVHRFPGEPPVAAQDRRRRFAHDAALSPARRAFERRFPGSSRITTIL